MNENKSKERPYVQSLVAEARRADIRWNEDKVKIGGPVAEGVRAAESEDGESKSVVNGYIAGYASQKSGAVP